MIIKILKKYASKSYRCFKKLFPIFHTEVIVTVSKVFWRRLILITRPREIANLIVIMIYCAQFWLYFQSSYDGPTEKNFILKINYAPHLSCKRNQIKMRGYMDRRVTSAKRVTSLTWGPPPPCINRSQLTNLYCYNLHFFSFVISRTVTHIYLFICIYLYVFIIW